MKEQYWNEDTIGEVTASMLSSIQEKLRPRELQLKPGRIALLVLDMQKYFLHRDSHACIPSAQAIIPAITQLRDACTERGYPVIFTQHVNTPEDARQMSQWWNEVLTVENPMSGIISPFSENPSNIIVKTQYDAFHGTTLDRTLRELNIEQVIVTGVMTHLCCESTARSAFMHGYEVIFPIDGTATYRKEFHEATLLNLSHGFAHIVTIHSLLQMLTALNFR